MLVFFEISDKNLKYITEGINADGFKKLAYQKAIEEEIENKRDDMIKIKR